MRRCRDACIVSRCSSYRYVENFHKRVQKSFRFCIRLGIYFLATLLLICVGCIVSVFVLVIQRRGLYGYVLPPMLKRMSKYLGSSLGLDEVYYEHNYTARCYRVSPMTSSRTPPRLSQVREARDHISGPQKYQKRPSTTTLP